MLKRSASDPKDSDDLDLFCEESIGDVVASPAKKQKSTAEEKLPVSVVNFSLFEKSKQAHQQFGLNHPYLEINTQANELNEEIFVYCKLMAEKKDALPIRGIIAFDVDGTMVDFERSIDESQQCFILKEELIRTLKLAKKNNYRIVIATSRPFPGDVSNRHISISSILKEFDTDLFTGVYFTNGHPKTYVLNDLHKQHPHLKKSSVCLVDDIEVYFQPCRDAGYTVIEVTDRNDHLKYVREFANDGCPEEIYQRRPAG